MEVDEAAAAALGWPKLKYATVERERRWLLADLPLKSVVRSRQIVDLYVDGSELRLREETPQGGEPSFKLGRKTDVDPATRLTTSIYLAQAEYRLLASLPGRWLRKTRHTLRARLGVTLSVDVFEGELAGLILAEAEFPDLETLRRYPSPEFAKREVTEDLRYSGARLAREGLPG